MSEAKYLQAGFDKQLSHFIEECGEALAAAGKTQRWGPAGVNPELPPKEQESNLQWLMREMDDVEEAIGRLRETIENDFGQEGEHQEPDND